MINLFSDIFKEYRLLVAEADKRFSEMLENYGEQVKCGVRCSDCCSSVFGLFLVESVYLNYEFGRLDRKRRREILQRGEKADRELREIERKLAGYGQPEAQVAAMGRERIRCPLLGSEEKCLLYEARPLTCRVYGIPTVINGKIRACWKAGFAGGDYPAFDLDGAYRELYRLSQRILARVGHRESDRAALLVSVAGSIKIPAEELLKPLDRKK